VNDPTGGEARSFPEQGSIYRRIARNSALMAGGTAISSLFTMLAVALSARALNAHDFGVLVLMQSAVLGLRGASSFATQQPVIKLGADAQAAEDRNRLGRIVSMGVVVDAASSLVAFAVAAIAIKFFRGALDLADRDVGFAWIFAGSLLFSAYPSSNGIFRLFNRFGVLAVIQVLSAIALFAAAIVLYAIHPTFEGFALAWAAYLAISGQAQLWSSLYLVSRDGSRLTLSRHVFRSEDGRTLLNYCWSTWGTSTADTVRANGDSLMVGAIVSVQAAGVYNVARQVAGVLRKFNMVYASTVFPEISKLAASGASVAAVRLKKRMMWSGMAFGILTVIAVALLAPFFLPLVFGPRFASAYVPLLILIAAAMAQLLSYTPSMYVQIYRSPQMLLALTGIALVLFLASGISLTFAWGTAGMATAQLVYALALMLLCEQALKSSALNSRRTGRHAIAISQNERP